jgi:predicted ArsR family transcriptional regulator
VPPDRTGARPRKDTRARILAVLTPELATLDQIAKRAGIPGRGRQHEAFLVLTRLEAAGLAIKEMPGRVPRWRASQAAPAAPRSGIGPEA